MARRKGHHDTNGESKAAKKHVDKRKQKARATPPGSYEGLRPAEIAKIRTGRRK